MFTLQEVDRIQKADAAKWDAEIGDITFRFLRWMPKLLVLPDFVMAQKYLDVTMETIAGAILSTEPLHADKQVSAVSLRP